MDQPDRIVDLHTHLFNARYIPLASVIANAMGKDESNLANHVARLLEALTGSSYQEDELLVELQSQNEDTLDEYRLEKFWRLTRHELITATGSLDSINNGLSILQEEQFSAPAFSLLRSSELMTIIEDLSKADYVAEGWIEAQSPTDASVAPYDGLIINWQFGGVLDWAEKVVKKALRAVTSLMDQKAWGKAENYLEFFLTMLNSEEKMLAKLIAGYGDDLPPLQISHYMMDMQMAYPLHKAPYYHFYPAQVDRMQLLQRANPARVFGFSAFDPRRDDWLTHAEDSLARGFIGFKFYPALGYKPTGNKAELQSKIDAFFDFCIERDAAIFVHCTPRGFQTRKKEGANAHPKYWRNVLANSRWSELRLCLGHAGGERMENGTLRSPGWMAESDAEWNDLNNFARIVTELCTTYPKVYCEVGCITALFDADSLETFVSNIERARNAAVVAGRPFSLLDKMAYGSDWHMPDMVDNTRDYLDAFLSIMNRDAYRTYLDKFFWRNAYSFLKLPA